MKRARIILADDHTLTLEGIRAVIEPHHEIVGMVLDGRALVDAALRLNPDLIVLDITMPLLNGIDAAVQIKKSLPGVKLLFVTMHVNPAYLEAALSAGGNGYVLKSAAREELLEAIQSVMDGRIYVTPVFRANTWSGSRILPAPQPHFASVRGSGRFCNSSPRAAQARKLPTF